MCGVLRLGPILLLWILSLTAWGLTPEEDKEFLKEDIHLFCAEEIQADCTGIYNCMVRRDSCVNEGKARSKSKCDQYHRCNRDNHGVLGGTSCAYRWIEHKSVSFCDVSSPGWTRSYHCPGNIDNFANDNNFYDCNGAKIQYENTRAICEERKSKLMRKYPGSDSQSYVARYKLSTCSHYQNFTRNITGEYSIFKSSESRKNIVGGKGIKGRIRTGNGQAVGDDVRTE